jgi:hypothetical protein
MNHVASTGPGPAELSEDHLLRELEESGNSRQRISLAHSQPAMSHRTQRMAALEQECPRNHEEGDVGRQCLRPARRDVT